MPHTTLLLLSVQSRSHTCRQWPSYFTSTAPSVTRLCRLALARMGLSRTSSSRWSCRAHKVTKGPRPPAPAEPAADLHMGRRGLRTLKDHPPTLALPGQVRKQRPRYEYLPRPHSEHKAEPWSVCTPPLNSREDCALLGIRLGAFGVWETSAGRRGTFSVPPGESGRWTQTRCLRLPAGSLAQRTPGLG